MHTSQQIQTRLPSQFLDQHDDSPASRPVGSLVPDETTLLLDEGQDRLGDVGSGTSLPRAPWPVLSKCIPVAIGRCGRDGLVSADLPVSKRLHARLRWGGDDPVRRHRRAAVLGRRVLPTDGLRLESPLHGPLKETANIVVDEWGLFLRVASNSAEQDTSPRRGGFPDGRASQRGAPSAQSCARPAA